MTANGITDVSPRPAAKARKRGCASRAYRESRQRRTGPIKLRRVSDSTERAFMRGPIDTIRYILVSLIDS